MIPPNNEDTFSLSYHFSSQEIAVLAKFLREKEKELPDGLEHFYKALEDSVYNCLSIEEVKNFYS